MVVIPSIIHKQSLIKVVVQALCNNGHIIRIISSDCEREPSRRIKVSEKDISDGLSSILTAGKSKEMFGWSMNFSRLTGPTEEMTAMVLEL